MPEVILPCPACGDDCIIVAKNYPSGKWHTYCYCGHIGRLYPTRKESIAAHNALPRAIRWTHEPPQVAGWYYIRDRTDESCAWNYPTIQRFSDGHIKTFKTTPLMQFAGPIPAPVDG